MTDKAIKNAQRLVSEQKAPERTIEQEMASDEPADVETQNIVYYKYLCPRCTGIAYVVDCIEIDHPQLHCNSCKMLLPKTVDQTRFIKLTVEEMHAAGIK